MSKLADPLLFSVLIDQTGTSLALEFAVDRANRTRACLESLLQITGFEPRLSHRIDKVGKDWLVEFHVGPTFLAQLDLFEVTRTGRPTVQDVSAKVIEAAVVAIHRFRRETGGVIAARIEETLKQLRWADPRVITALAKQPAKSMTLRNDSGDFTLSVQSESHRTISAAPEELIGFIRTIGFTEMTVVPVHKRSPTNLCIHPLRIRIPESLRNSLDPIKVLTEFVKPQQRLQFKVQREDVVRKRQHLTFLLAEWPPLRLSKGSGISTRIEPGFH